MEQAIKQIRELYQRGNFEEVIRQAKPILEKREPGENEYDFEDLYQQFLYVYGFSFGEAVCAPYAFGDLAMMTGASAMERHRLTEAKDAFCLALEWNPLSVGARFYLAEVAKEMKNNADIRKYTREALPYCYLEKDLSRAYRNFAYLALEEARHEDAAVFHYAALAFGDKDDEKIIRGELAFLTAVMGKVIQEPTPAEVLSTFAKYDLPFGFHPVHLQLAQELLRKGKEMNSDVLVSVARGVLEQVGEDTDLS